ncbi:hypothetical protein MASR1M65_04630 [Saprospiraceae bacterium]
MERRYLFRMVARRAPVTRDRGLVWQVPNAPDLAAMRAGAAHLVGRHNFTTFRSAMCQADSPVKTLDEISDRGPPLPGGREFRFTLRARSFLHNQVRSIAGTLERVGAGAGRPMTWPARWRRKPRRLRPWVSPPDGLYLDRGRGIPVETRSAETGLGRDGMRWGLARAGWDGPLLTRLPP